MASGMTFVNFQQIVQQLFSKLLIELQLLFSNCLAKFQQLETGQEKRGCKNIVVDVIYFALELLLRFFLSPNLAHLLLVCLTQDESTAPKAKAKAAPKAKAWP